MEMVNFGHLRYFWAVAHEGSLTRAALALNVSQSAVSVQIQKLEDALGRPLFERRGRRLVLTDAGRRALDHADAIFEIGGRLLRSMRNDAQPARQILRVGAVATLSRNFQMAFLSPALRRADVGLALRSGSLRVLLRLLESHQLDVVLSNVAPPRDQGLPWLAQLVARQPVSVVGHPTRIGTSRNWRHLLRREPLIVPTTESGIRGGLDVLLHSLGISPTFAAEVDDMAMLRLMVRQDVGLGIVPSIVVRDELATGELTQVARLPDLHETFYAVTLPRQFVNPLVTTLIEVASGAIGPASATIRRSRSSARGRTVKR
jgi:LysR family transcriptional regulator, transcriptional activator of nhaA